MNVFCLIIYFLTFWTFRDCQPTFANYMQHLPRKLTDAFKNTWMMLRTLIDFNTFKVKERLTRKYISRPTTAIPSTKTVSIIPVLPVPKYIDHYRYNIWMTRTPKRFVQI